MSTGHDKLKSIGAQKIHEATHISRLHVQAVIHESYDDMNRIQFLGFISILEREYNIDLSELKARGIAHFDEIVPSSQEASKVFVGIEKKKNYTSLYAIIAALIFVGVAYLSLVLTSSEETKIDKVDNTNIKNATANITTSQIEDKADVKSELTSTQELNSTIEDTITQIQRSFVIKPVSDLWIGYMDLDTNKKYQKTILKSEELSIDANKNWLLTFGHGYFSIDINGQTIKYTDKNTVRFTYKDFNMTKITYREFLELEKGN